MSAIRRYTDRTGRQSEAFIAAESVSGANPGANSEASITVPTGERWLLKSVSIALSQGATQTPYPGLIIDDGTNTLFEAKSGTAAQAVSTDSRHTWAPGLPLSQAGATPDIKCTGPLPSGLVLEAGYRIRTNTVGKGAATDWGIPWALVHKLPV